MIECLYDWMEINPTATGTNSMKFGFLNHSTTHSLIHSFIHSLIHSFIHSFIPSSFYPINLVTILCWIFLL